MKKITINQIINRKKSEESMKKVISFSAAVLTGALVFAAGDSNWFKAQSKEARIVSASATSELVEAQFEGRYLYSPANMLDGDMSTTWCEAEKNGPGLGQVITFEFESPFSFDEIQIVNGFNYKNLYLQNNRVKKIQLTQVAKKHFQQKDYELADNVQDWQSIKFEQLQTTQTLTIKILDVYKGTNFDDTCLSDIRFLCKGKVIPFKGVDELKAIQNENSKMLLNKDAKNFKKDFFALFKPRTGAASTGDLILMPEKGDLVYQLVKDGDRLSYMKRSYIYPVNQLEETKKWTGGYMGFADAKTKDVVNLYDHPELAGNAKYIAIEPNFWYDEPTFELKDYKIIKTEYIDYVITETATIVKLDGNNVFLNGVCYTVFAPEDFIIVSIPE